mgnify:CR=1 FL=1
MRIIAPLIMFISALLTTQVVSAAGDPAPDFKLPYLTQKGNTSLSAYRGKVVYVDFWASWCGPCRKSLPFLDGVRKDLKGKGFEVLAINLDEDVKAAREFLKQYPVSYPTLHDADGNTPDAFGLRGMPTSYLIDRQGKIRVIHQGFKPSDSQKIRAEITALVSAK